MLVLASAIVQPAWVNPAAGGPLSSSTGSYSLGGNLDASLQALSSTQASLGAIDSMLGSARTMGGSLSTIGSSYGSSYANGDGARAGAEACGEWRGFVDFLADLYLMGACDGLVAKFTSNLPRLSFALQVARRGRLPPYVSIDNSTWCSNSRTGKGRSRWGPFPC